MINESFSETLRLAVGKLMDLSVDTIIGENAEYAADSDKCDKAEKAYWKLNLTEKQKAICDELILAREKSDQDYAYFAYLAGFGDGIRTTAYLNPESLKNNELESILKSILTEN